MRTGLVTVFLLLSIAFMFSADNASAGHNSVYAKVAELKPLPPVDPKVAEADDACASYAGAILSHAEGDDVRLVAEWKFKCEHHPLQKTCESTRKFMQETTPVGALHCAGGSRSH